MPITLTRSNETLPKRIKRLEAQAAGLANKAAGLGTVAVLATMAETFDAHQPLSAPAVEASMAIAGASYAVMFGAMWKRRHYDKDSQRALAAEWESLVQDTDMKEVMMGIDLRFPVVLSDDETE